jgi:hypothetical protein
MGNILGKEKPLKEVMRENKRTITRAIRELDREKVGLEKEEKRLTMEIKKAAKENQMQSVKIMAKVSFCGSEVYCRVWQKRDGRGIRFNKNTTVSFLFSTSRLTMTHLYYNVLSLSPVAPNYFRISCERGNTFPNSLKCEVTCRDVR